MKPQVVAAPEPPKIAFQTPAAPPSVPAGKVNPTFASPNVDQAVRNLAHGEGSGGQAVGDAVADLTGPGPGLNLPPSAGRPRSNLELKSDPMGVDFRPYLTRVLLTVRRNWFAIYPETARLGLRGRVVVEFSVGTDGKILKVVYSAQSGSRPLDEAAVAALSASNPLPPLPSEFKGQRIVLQFTFSYNIPVR
jgi:TonB family protein